MPVAVCPQCQRRVKLPDNPSGRTVQTLCPKCGELLPVPPNPSRHPDDARVATIQDGAAQAGRLNLRAELAGATASARNTGLVVLALGLIALLSLLLFCLPFHAYVGLAVSGIGLLFGLYGALRGLRRRERNVWYAVAGIGVCGLALGLNLTQILVTPASQTSGGQSGAPTLLEQEKELR